VAGKPVWGRLDAGEVEGFPWTWVELLEHLASQWTALMWEELDPLGLGGWVSSLRRRASVAWADRVDDDGRARDERTLLRFERSHDLAFAVGGAALPSLWLLREGGEMRVGAWGRELRRPLVEVKATLEAIGDEIAARLTSTRDERASAAREAWTVREHASLDSRLGFATGLTPGALREVEADREAPYVWGFVGDLLQPTPQLAAARMMGRAAPPPVIAHVVDWIHSLEPRDTPDLDGLSTRAVRPVALADRRAFARGYALALWLRSIPGVTDSNGRVDPDALLEKFGVLVEDRDLGWADIEAVACWGARRGPAVLVNRVGKHAQTTEGRRSTLAHEICHLLVDRARSLPLAEVLGGRAPAYAEQRANAFAAEFLLPRVEAATVLGRAGVASKLVTALKRRFDVSGQIVAWQAIRSDAVLPPATVDYLRTLVPRKDQPRFDRAVQGRGLHPRA
jgi:Zn-dependent peptidase ImmA (M78 family)